MPESTSNKSSRTKDKTSTSSIDSLLLYMKQEELIMELQTLSKLRRRVPGNIMQKKRQTKIHDYIYSQTSLNARCRDHSEENPKVCI